MDEERKKYFESFVDEWDKMFTAEDIEIISFLIDSFNIQDSNKVVDLGCGTGILFDMLRRKVGNDGFVVGVDFCAGMIRRAKRNFPFENIYEVDADVEYLPLQNEFFDVAISFAAFAHFAHPQLVMNEVSRVLKKGGQFHIIHLLGSRELVDFHHKEGGPLSEDHLPATGIMNEFFEHGHFKKVKITDHPGLYLASAIKE